MRPALKRILPLLLASSALAGGESMTLEQFLGQYRRGDPEARRCELVSRLGAARDPAAVETLARLLQSERSFPCLQCYAIKALCEEGSPAALGAVLTCLSDRRLDPCVPLFARRALATVQNPKGLAWMKSQAWKEAERREDLAWALAQDQAWRDSAFFLDHLDAAKEKDFRLRAASALGLCRLNDPDSADAVLLAAQQEEEPAVLLRLLPAAGRLCRARALPLFERRLQHPDPRARLGALEGLAWMAADKDSGKEALGLLVQALGREGGRLRADAARFLEAVTGKTFGLDVAQWRTFLQQRGAPLPEGFQEAHTETPKHLGVDMPSQRVVFLVETSSEMIRDRATAQLSDRLDRAKKELLKRIEALPDDAVFGVIAYGQSVSRWHETMVQATPAAKVQARAWVAKLAGSGWPDPGAGLQAAWALGGAGAGPEVSGADTVVLVGAGTPVDRGLPVQFSGALRYPFALPDWVALQGRYRSVVLHTVGIGTSADKKTLKDLAAATGGTYRNID